ncbi:hypothetical protein GLOIN_2v1528664 [Rhizophagus irregularis DAOM 181602=DAOM 197198]|uniref:Uncharacterized protein n=1 Tax=Rhizophagus irregularis (strain DAOM 181602 / DAOM 197198 / MUCL 43194) TaxID=747089 RepID=A0A2P4QNK4_RHIID|nr:hypothetical protein GLOIN_2v1528664 [Rhizophagus irregularis DAOM 181602=DAOM 197198]POG79210.1 hypothetical protein GLOIN_2v1528664 [Rhizophagus irregularis DAOM 181602=DAOM 197198]|eukprot:XP_025186076.1 hypothetical protein GLOIN_2v1528664 [Rhizophagus irregularis DAOM 181602=DAOM 197198]
MKLNTWVLQDLRNLRDLILSFFHCNYHYVKEVLYNPFYFNIFLYKLDYSMKLVKLNFNLLCYSNKKPTIYLYL